jgi:hypothetical protein
MAARSGRPYLLEVAMIARAKRVHSHEDRFVEMLPTLLRVIRHRLRNQPRRDREELAAEALAAAFAMYVNLVRRGKEAMAYPTPLGTYGVRQAIDGRQMGSGTNVLDISSRCCQQRKGVSVTSLDRYDQKDEDWREIVVEDRHCGPAEVVATKVDFEDWLAELSPKQRRIAKTLATGETTKKAARKHRVSPGRISQIRRELMARWNEFIGEDQQAVAAVTA